MQELGVAIGVATLGSLIGVVYRSGLGDSTFDGLSGTAREEAGSSLAAAAGIVDRLPEEAWRQAQQAFTTGLNAAAGVAGVAILVLAVISMVSLRSVPTIGDADHQGPAVEPETEPTVPGASTAERSGSH